MLLMSNLTLATAFEEIDIDVSGETNYSKSSSEELSTILKANFKIKIHEPSHKRWGLFFTGNISPDYDVFQKVLKVNTFKTISFEF